MIIRHEITFDGNSQNFSNQARIIDPNQLSGTLTFYFELVLTQIGSPGPNSISLIRRSDRGVMVSIDTSTTTGYFRSAAFTPNFSATEYVVDFPSIAQIPQAKNVRVVIIQDTGTSNLTALEEQVEIGSYMTSAVVSATNTLQPISSPKYWTFNSANWDGSVSVFGECVWITSSTTGNKTIVIQQDDGNFANWTTVATMVSASIGDTVSYTRSRSSASFTPVNGRHYRVAWSNSSTMSNVSMISARLIIVQTGTNITKTECQFLLAHVPLAAGTALQNFLTKFDPAEWSGVDVTYVHQVDASASNTSVVEIDTEAGSQISGSVVSSPNNVGVSSAMTMPGSSGNLDVKATTNSGNIFGSRIIASVSKQSSTQPPAQSTKVLFGLLGVG